MDVYACQKEILAAADFSGDGTLWRAYRFEPGFGRRTLYLYAILAR